MNDALARHMENQDIATEEARFKITQQPAVAAAAFARAHTRVSSRGSHGTVGFQLRYYCESTANENVGITAIP